MISISIKKFQSKKMNKNSNEIVNEQPTSSKQYQSRSGQTTTGQGNKAMINKVVGDEREDEMEQNLNMVISLNTCRFCK